MDNTGKIIFSLLAYRDGRDYVTSESPVNEGNLYANIVYTAFGQHLISAFLSSFSKNLLAFYHECRSLIGYATQHLFNSALALAAAAAAAAVVVVVNFKLGFKSNAHAPLSPRNEINRKIIQIP